MSQAVDSMFDLCKFWPCDSMFWDLGFLDLLPDLDSSQRQLLHCVPVWTGETVDAVHIYVDGSSFGLNRQDLLNRDAGWAFIVLLQCEHAMRFYGATSNTLDKGKMYTNQSNTVGELLSDALSAEAAGMIWVLAWTFQNPFHVPCIIHYDNCTVGQFASGENQWQPTWEYHYLRRNLEALRHCLLLMHRLPLFQHQKSHDNHPWSDAVDALAKAVTKRIVVPPPLPQDVCVALNNPRFQFAWMHLVPFGQVPCPTAMRAVFQTEGPHLHAPPDDVTWCPAHVQESVLQVKIHVTFASMNVLTLAPGSKKAQHRGLMQKGRIATLQRQCHDHGFHIIGLQECRTQGTHQRSSSSHVAFQSGAHHTGSRGCELWIDKSLPYASSKTQKFCFQVAHFHVASFDDRHLLTICRAPHFHVRLLVIHAPYDGQTEVDCSQWWASLEQTLLQSDTTLPLVILGDFNAHVGSISSDAVSSYGQEPESTTGTLMHSFLLEHRLWAPATFAECHHGESYTLTSPDGHTSRNDFVVIPDTWKAFAVSSQVDYSFDLLNSRDDHHVVTLEVHMGLHTSTHASSWRPRIDTRKCTQADAVTKFCNKVSQFPPIPWEVGVGVHAELITSWLHHAAHECFQADRSLPRQRYMSPETWELVQLRKQFFKASHAVLRQAKGFLVHMVFNIWKTCIRLAKACHPRPADVFDVIVPQHYLRNCYLLYRLVIQCECYGWWLMHQRTTLHPFTRHASKQDRVREATLLVEEFEAAAHRNDPRKLYRSLRMLLGQTQRKNLSQFRPLPAIKMSDGRLAKDHDEAIERLRHHFAAPEDGLLLTPAQIQEMVSVSSPRHAPDQLHFDINALPNLGDIQAYILAARRNKSPGPDGLPAEVFKTDAVLMSQLLWPLMAKCSLRCAEPTRWRGGEIFALPKTNQISFVADKYRSILLADFLSKVSHGMLRKRLLPVFETCRFSTQAGGIPKLGTDMLHLFIQSFAQRAKTLQVSSGALFIDLKQAFYRACRPLLVKQYVSDVTLAQLFVQHGWSSTLFQEFKRNVFSPPALVQAGASSHLTAQVSSMLSTTWFNMRHDLNSFTCTRAGTKPGDSVADLLFAFIMSRFLEVVRARFVQEGLHIELPLMWLPLGSVDIDDMPLQQIVQACWVDDVVFLFQNAKPGQLVHHLARALQLVHEIAATFGLALNHGIDKTAVILALRGPGARTTWNDLQRDNAQHPVITFECSLYDHPMTASIMPDYLYLGSLQDHTGNPSCDVKRRLLAVQPLMRLLQKNVFRSPRFPVAVKCRLFKALVLTRIMYGAGAWQQMHIHTLRHFNSQMWVMYSRIVNFVHRGPGSHRLDVIAACNMVPPLMLLIVQRFSLFDRLMQTEMTEVLSVLQAQDPNSGWLAQIHRDIIQVGMLVSDDDLVALAKHQDDSRLAQLSYERPKLLTNFVKRATKVFLAYAKIWLGFRNFQKSYMLEADTLGVGFTVDSVPPLPLDMPHSFHCDQCAATFDSYQKLCTHAFKQHGTPNLAQRYASTNVCRACLKMYNSRQEVIHHLKYMRTGCLVKLVMCKDPLTDEDLISLQEANKDVRRQKRNQLRTATHRLHMTRAAGPLLPWPWQRQLGLLLNDCRPPPSVEDTLWPQVCETVLHATLNGELDAAFQALHSVPYHGDLAHHLVQTMLRTHSQPPALDQAQQQVLISEAIALWQDAALVPPLPSFHVPGSHHVLCSLRSLSLTTQPRETLPLSSVLKRQVIADRLWEDDFVPSRLAEQVHLESRKHITHIQVRELVLHCAPVYLYVFSGRRREGDFQMQIERFLEEVHVSGQVLLVDLALSTKHDVYKEELLATFKHWIANGWVAGLLIAPPCETWSEVRNIQDAEHDPRPLRSAQEPMCIPQLTVSELEQLEVSNHLLFVAIRLVFWATCHSVPSITEHPRAPKLLERASIWRLPWYTRLFQARLLVKHEIYQARFGSASAKPTTFAVGYLPRFKRCLSRFHRPVQWKELQVLSGKAEQGGWNTSKAKEYPPDLNAALAWSFVDAYTRSRTCRKEVHEIAEFQTQFSALYAGDVDFNQQHIQPDFHLRGDFLSHLD
eukprot:Skav224498  [mRNA]  locus=scaffold1478:110944:117147:- [translate_table: standard]